MFCQGVSYYALLLKILNNHIPKRNMRINDLIDISIKTYREVFNLKRLMLVSILNTRLHVYEESINNE